MARRDAPPIPNALLDRLLRGADPQTIFDAGSLVDAGRHRGSQDNGRAPVRSVDLRSPHR